jgi:hypothetical protein
MKGSDQAAGELVPMRLGRTCAAEPARFAYGIGRARRAILRAREYLHYLAIGAALIRLRTAKGD